MRLGRGGRVFEEEDEGLAGRWRRSGRMRRPRGWPRFDSLITIVSTLSTQLLA